MFFENLLNNITVILFGLFPLFLLLSSRKRARLEREKREAEKRNIEDGKTKQAARGTGRDEKQQQREAAKSQTSRSVVFLEDKYERWARTKQKIKIKKAKQTPSKHEKKYSHKGPAGGTGTPAGPVSRFKAWLESLDDMDRDLRVPVHEQDAKGGHSKGRHGEPFDNRQRARPVETMEAPQKKGGYTAEPGKQESAFTSQWKNEANRPKPDGGITTDFSGLHGQTVSKGFTKKLQSLNPLQQAVLMSTVLGRPRGYDTYTGSSKEHDLDSPFI